MKNAYALYLQSWKEHKKIGVTFLIGGIILLLLFLVVAGFGQLLTAKAYALSGGKSPEQLKVDLLNNSIEKNQAFIDSIKSLIYIFVGGVILVALVLLFLYSAIPFFIWNYLLTQSYSLRRYWRWNAFNLVMAIILLIYIVFSILLVFITNVLFPSGTGLPRLIFSSVLSWIYLLLFFIFYTAAAYTFAQKYKVWESIGNAFSLLKEKRSAVGKMSILVMGTILLLYLVLFLTSKILVPQTIALVTINLALLLLFLSWFRIYLLKVIS